MIRVLIERRVLEDRIPEYQLAVRAVRLEAMHRDGYISGETLRDVEDRTRFVVVSTWNNQEAWTAWAGTDTRRMLMAKLEPMLAESEQITVLEPV